MIKFVKITLIPILLTVNVNFHKFITSIFHLFEVSVNDITSIYMIRMICNKKL